MNKARILRLLKDIEWNGVKFGQPTSMGGNNGPAVSCCPDCRGIRPGSPYTGHFTSASVGHQDGCELRAAIKALNARKRKLSK